MATQNAGIRNLGALFEGPLDGCSTGRLQTFTSNVTSGRSRPVVTERDETLIEFRQQLRRNPGLRRASSNATLHQAGDGLEIAAVWTSLRGFRQPMPSGSVTAGAVGC